MQIINWCIDDCCCSYLSRLKISDKGVNKRQYRLNYEQSFLSFGSVFICHWFKNISTPLQLLRILCHIMMTFELSKSRVSMILFNRSTPLKLWKHEILNGCVKLSCLIISCNCATVSLRQSCDAHKEKITGCKLPLVRIHINRAVGYPTPRGLRTWAPQPLIPCPHWPPDMPFPCTFPTNDALALFSPAVQA